MKMYETPQELNAYLDRHFECACGRVHYAPLKSVRIGPNALAELPECIKSLGYMTTIVFSDMICTGISSILQNGAQGTMANDFMNSVPQIVMTRLLFFLVLAVLTAVAYLLLNRGKNPAEPLDSRALLLLLIPMSQLISADIFLSTLQANVALPMAGQAIAVIAAVSVLTDAAYFRVVARMQRESVLKKQVATAERELDNQLSHYREMEADMLQVSRVRHDLNNQLTTAYCLFEKGEREEALRQLDVLKKELGSRVGPSYCANLAVDAVLSEKAAACGENGIELKTELNLPARLPIEGAHLCSVFANLMDNAIDGCLAAEGPRRIALTAGLRQGYLAIRCENTAKNEAQPRRKKPAALAEHGLGLGILRMLAERYAGTFTAGPVSGGFTAEILLRLPEQAEAVAQ